MQLSPGSFRPIYLWAGSGTRRMNRLKFMGAEVDDKIHDLAHSEAGAERIAKMGFNWVYLTYNWGFPPEIEEIDWVSFERAVEIYHKRDIRVSGYIQSSNCVNKGSYRNKDWYSLDPQGKKIHYYTGRFLTCLIHPEWRGEVRERVRRVVEAGADGLFFDNPWFGGAGEEWRNAIIGNLGCYHPLTQAAYHEVTGDEIPHILDLNDPKSRQYLQWRADQVTDTLRYWADFARELNPEIMIAANNFDTFNRNELVEVGIDFRAMAKVQDVMLLENFAQPRRLPEGAVVSNAPVIGAGQSHSGGTPVSAISYEKGIGFDRVWSPRTFILGMAEIIAMNAIPVIKGTEYLYRKSFTLLIHHRYEAQHEALGRMNCWMEKNTAWLTDRKASSPIAIYHPYSAMIFRRSESAMYFYGACETLFFAGLPFRIVGEGAWDGVKALIVPPGVVTGLDERLMEFSHQGGRVIALGQARPGTETVLWRKYHRQRWPFPKWRSMRRLLRRVTSLAWSVYHNRALARFAADRMGLPQRVLKQDQYHLPPSALQEDLLNALEGIVMPHIEANQPVLFTMWHERNGREQYYLVNYGDEVQSVTLHLPQLVAAEVYTPGKDEPPAKVAGNSLLFQLDVAKVIRTIPPNH